MTQDLEVIVSLLNEAQRKAQATKITQCIVVSPDGELLVLSKFQSYKYSKCLETINPI